MLRLYGIGLIFCLVVSTAFAKANTSLQKTDTKLTSLLTHINILKADLQQTLNTQQKTSQQVKTIDLQIAKSADAFAKTQTQQQAQQSLLNQLQNKQRQLENTLHAEQSALAEQLAHAYRFYQTDPIALILNQDQTSEMDRMLTYYHTVNRARLETLATLHQTLTALHQNEQAIIDKRNLLNALKTKQLKQKTDLLKQYKKQITLLNQVDHQLHHQQTKLDKLETDKKALKHLLTRLQAQQTQQTQQTQGQFFIQHKGHLPFPTQGHVTLGFNDAISSQSHIPLHGILIQAKTNQPVKAIAPGKVVFADWLRGMGLLIIIDHSNGYMSLYGHNQTLQKHPGDTVKQGQIIARVGQSGGQATPGLYFAIRHNGVALDPMDWIRRR